MEVVKTNYLNKKYGCVCNRCGSVFVFDESETDTIQVICPVCQYSNKISDCTELLDKNAEKSFKMFHSNKPIIDIETEYKRDKLLYQLKRFYNSNTICFDIFIILFSILIICLICLIPK